VAVSPPRSSEPQAPRPAPALEIPLPTTKPNAPSPPPVPVPAAPLTPTEQTERLVADIARYFDEIDLRVRSMESSERELAEQVLLRIEEIFGRCGVDTIEGDVVFDRLRHQPDPGGPLGSNGAPIAATLSPGFMLASRVLRRARVRLADTAAGSQIVCELNP
jgi:hypothetical protein